MIKDFQVSAHDAIRLSHLMVDLTKLSNGRAASLIDPENTVRQARDLMERTGLRPCNKFYLDRCEETAKKVMAKRREAARRVFA
jgi:uncharacterized protein with PIN domain